MSNKALIEAIHHFTDKVNNQSHIKNARDVEHLEVLIKHGEESLDQSPTHEGMNNIDLLARARKAVK